MLRQRLLLLALRIPLLLLFPLSEILLKNLRVMILIARLKSYSRLFLKSFKSSLAAAQWLESHRFPVMARLLRLPALVPRLPLALRPPRVGRWIEPWGILPVVLVDNN